MKPLSSQSAIGVITIFPYGQKNFKYYPLLLSLTLIYNLLPSNRSLAESPVHNFFSFVAWAEQNYRKPLRTSHTTLASASLRYVCVSVHCQLQIKCPFTNAVIIEAHSYTRVTRCKGKIHARILFYVFHHFCDAARGLFCFEELDFIFLVYSLFPNLPCLFLPQLVMIASRPLTQTTTCLAGTHACIKAFWG